MFLAQTLLKSLVLLMLWLEIKEIDKSNGKFIKVIFPSADLPHSPSLKMLSSEPSKAPSQKVTASKQHQHEIVVYTVQCLPSQTPKSQL